MNRFTVSLFFGLLLLSIRSEAFTILYSQTNVSCNGGNNGAIDITPTGGVSPYTFAWSNSAITEDISGLNAGTYSVSVTDAALTVQTASFIITQPVALAISATTNPVSCSGTNNGSVMVDMQQGTGPYSWTLNGPPSMTPDVTDENFKWVRQGGGTGTLDNKAWSVCADQHGNVYATGEFYNSISMGNAVFTSSGNSDIFIARYTSSGTLVWARRVGGAGYDTGFGIACDTSGNVYVTGRFRNTVTFGTFTLTSYDVDDFFLAKYDSNGNCLWVYHPVSTSSDYGWSLAVDPAGNSYVTGYYTGNITFTPLATMSAPSGFNILLTKINTSGTPVWATQSTGTFQNQGYSIAIDNSGNSYITGYFTNTTTFGTHSVTSNGSRDIFVAKYDNNGVAQWAHSAGGVSDDYGIGVCTDNLGNAYVTGYFRNTINFGSGSISSVGADDMFLVKYNPAGTALWTVRGGGASNDRGGSVSCDQYNNVYVTGFYYSNATFGSFNLPTGGFNELFVLRYTSNGVIQLAKNVNGPNYEEGYCVFNDKRGSTYVSGMFGSTTSFGGIPMTSLGTHDFFVSRFSMTDARDTVNNLSPGNYTATVTDFNGCTSSASVVITQPQPIVVTPSLINPACNGGTGSTTLAISGGTPSYSTNWGSTNPNALAAGTYSVTVTDAGGCDTTISITITQPPAITATVSALPPTCSNNCNGSISVLPSGGTPGYSYLWSNGNVNDSISGLCEGSFSVTVTDASSCSSTFSTMIIAPTAIVPDLTAINESCMNSCNGSIVASISGGSPGYSYLWNNGFTSSGIYSLCAGNYSVTITDANSCVISASATITSPSQLVFNSILTDSDSLCTGQCANLSASVSGGNPGYSYSWLPVAGLNNATIINPVACPVVSTTYTLTATDANGCSISDSVFVFVDICMGIAHNEKSDLIIYPNPSSGIFNIDFGNLKMKEGSEIALTDISGRKIGLFISAEKNIQEIDLRNYADGIYFITFRTENGELISRKLVKE
jgi:hypothetical protein